MINTKLLINGYKQAWIDYAYKVRRVNKELSESSSKLFAIKKLKIIPMFSISVQSKERQLNFLLKSVKINNQGKGNFFYSIDEETVPLCFYKLIDNMPIDYSLVVNYSLDELKKNNSKTNNKILLENQRTIIIIKQYIDKICKTISNDITRKYILGIKSKKADTMEEALQRILFWNQILWQTKHCLVGLGRLDKVLERFNFPKNGEKIIEKFLLTLHQFYNYKSSSLLGDTGQIILLGGIEEDGTYFCNDYTHAFIKSLSKLKLSDPKILLRASNIMPSILLQEAAECIATGIGSPLISNDDIIIPNLIDFGYKQSDAYNYGVSACWEPLAIGKSLEQNNIATIHFGEVINKTITDKNFLVCKTQKELITLFYIKLKAEVERVIKLLNSYRWEYDPVQTLFTDGCIESGKDISSGGAIYNNYGVLSDGMSAAVNSIININKFCFESYKYSLSDIQMAIINNYTNSKELKVRLSLCEAGFGTDDENAILLTNSIIEKTKDFLIKYRNIYGGRVKFGLSSPSYVGYGSKVGATADGRTAGAPFSTHISRDNVSSPTELISFASKLKSNGISSNANVVDIMIQSNLLINNIERFTRLLLGAIKQGVFQMQFNVVSYKQLLEAKKNPGKFPSLIVRVWGFSAYFNDLPEDYQNALINRARKMEGV